MVYIFIQLVSFIHKLMNQRFNVQSKKLSTAITALVLFGVSLFLLFELITRPPYLLSF